MKRGFTLIELLVVIAIIGILSSVALVNLNSARDKARLAHAQATMEQIHRAAIICLNSNEANDILCTSTGGACDGSAGATLSRPEIGGAICSDASLSLGVWPELQGTWFYSRPASSQTAEGVAGEFYFSACSFDPDDVLCDDAGNTIITCTPAGCQTSTT